MTRTLGSLSIAGALVSSERPMRTGLVRDTCSSRQQRSLGSIRIFREHCYKSAEGLNSLFELSDLCMSGFDQPSFLRNPFLQHLAQER